MVTALALIPDDVWTPACNADGQVRDGAWLVDATGVLDLAGWPDGMRVILRKERPHPGAQLRFTDADGLRLTAFVTNIGKGQLADLELRHRRRARCEDRIRHAKSTGLQNLPLYGFDQNRIWLALVGLAMELTAWLQMPSPATTPAGGSRNGYGYACFRSPHASADKQTNPTPVVRTRTLGRPDRHRDHQTRRRTGTDLTYCQPPRQDETTHPDQEPAATR
jgi:hypothetical protein